jgi:hypothetical protein
MAGHVRRVLSTLSVLYAKEPIEPGHNAGTVLASMLTETFRAIGPPPELAIRRVLTEEAAGVVHELVGGLIQWNDCLRRARTPLSRPQSPIKAC